MKLPELDNKAIEEAFLEENTMTVAEVAQLHCLRSIAVSMESIAMLMATEFNGVTSSHMAGMMDQLEAHSVREVPGD